MGVKLGLSLLSQRFLIFLKWRHKHPKYEKVASHATVVSGFRHLSRKNVTLSRYM